MPEPLTDRAADAILDLMLLDADLRVETASAVQPPNAFDRIAMSAASNMQKWDAPQPTSPDPGVAENGKEMWR